MAAVTHQTDHLPFHFQERPISDQPPGGCSSPGQGPPPPALPPSITCRVMVLRPLVTACSRTPLAWRVRNMRLRCQGWEMGSERPCQATRLLPRKRWGLAISGEADKGRLRGGADERLRRYDAQCGAAPWEAGHCLS